MDKRQARKALIVAAFIELVPFALGLWALVAGGLHPGGAIFAALHIPGVFVVLPVSELLFELFSFDFAQVFSIILVVLVQILIFSVALYWITEFWKNRKSV